VSFVPGRQQFVQSETAGVLAERRDPVQRATDTIPIGYRRWHQVRHSPPMPGNDDGLSSLNLIEEFGEAGLDYRGLNLTHNKFVLTGQFD
jgi:hypothetical protein